LPILPRLTDGGEIGVFSAFNNNGKNDARRRRAATVAKSAARRFPTASESDVGRRRFFKIGQYRQYR